MQLFNIGVAYGLSEMILSLVVKKKNLPKANKIISFPSVALLYVTYNDVMPELLFKLKDQTYKNYDIFVLDDSTKEKCIEIIDNCGLSVVRRGNRTGFKAGSLNNWLILYGNKYDYFIIADSDSAFEKDFIENIVKYAEHPLNKNIAIFQSKILPWNDKNSFPRIVGAMAPLAIYFNEKLGNECSTIISWGHNNLHRTGIIVAEGGFDENFVSEDFATCLNLIKKGYECKM
ncbi:MAG: glycosyltransferase, partial [Candidatus Methanoperedens sp.]|nr:glycosyltransferase [Candidatus Methanoperedens sp.]